MTVRICHVTSAHSTDDVRILKKECVSLVQSNDFDVFLVGQGNSCNYEGVNIIGLGEIPKSRIKRMTNFTNNVVEKALELDADIYHLHDPELLRHVVKFKKLGKKVIFDSHENVLDSIDDKTYMPIVFRKAFKLYYRVLEKRVYPKLDGIIVVSPQMMERYRTYNNSIELVTNYPIVGKKETNQVDTEMVKGRLIFAGGITEQWSHREIINAIEKIEGVEYYLFGVADETYLKELKQLKGWCKVHFGGKIPFEDIQKEIKKAQVVMAVLKPSKNSFCMQGTLGNTKLFEAMENRKPVIATNFDLWKNIVEENHCGICVNSNDEISIRDAINKILNLSEDEYNSLGTNGRKCVEKEYNWENQAKKLIAFYKEVIIRESR